ncbi:MAG: M6 family metalloprotease domain-containing protein [Acidobacteria bacterium]|nr:M6 family metalloprotease domain-containing protein [Acidobacteriota bacterium]
MAVSKTRGTRLGATIGVVGVVGLLVLGTGFVPALEPPAPGMAAQYQADGTWAGRLAEAYRLGNHRPDAARMERLRYDLQYRYLENEGWSAAQIQSVLAPPPAWSGIPTTGNVKVLVLLIAFSDYAPITGDTQSAIDSRIFGSGTGGYPLESLKNYYQRASYSQLTFQGNVLGWYTTAYARSAVTQTDTGRETLIKEALNYYEGVGHDFTQYDNDGDGAVDYFAVIWTGPPGAWASFWWGYQTSFWDTSYTLDGKTLGKYSWQWESYYYPSGAFSPQVLIHETGHALGLPDYYDYDTTVGPQGGVGGLDMMDGNWGDHNAFSKYLLGWITPTVLGSGSTTKALRSSGTYGDALLVMRGASGSTLFGEFFLVQSRFREANDSTYPADGLLVWHVDATLDGSAWDYQYDNSYTSHKLLRLMEADGLEEIETGDGNADAGDYYTSGLTFGFGTTPNSAAYTGRPTGIVVDNIASGTLQMSCRATLYAVPTVAVTNPTAEQVVSGVVNIQATVGEITKAPDVIVKVEVFVNGVSLGLCPSPPYQLPWDTTPLPAGAYTLRVEATNHHGVVDYDEITVYVIRSSAQALVMDLGSDNGSGRALANALAHHNIRPVFATSVGAISASTYPLAFLCLGYTPGNYVLTPTDSTHLVNYLNAGGRLYLEGSPTWATDPPLPVHGMTGITGVASSAADLVLIQAPQGVFTSGNAFPPVGTQAAVSRLQVTSGVTDAAVIWANMSPYYFCGIARNTGVYRTIGCSCEFGLIPPPLRDGIMRSYLDFLRPRTAFDFNFNVYSDILWHNTTSGAVSTWLMNASGVAGSVGIQPPSGPYSDAAWQVVGVGDLDGDRKGDLFWRNTTTGAIVVWFVDENGYAGELSVATVDTTWRIVGVGDVDGDGRADIYWRNDNLGTLSVWLMTPSGYAGSLFVGGISDPLWQVVGIADVNGDGRKDIFWRRTDSGIMSVWLCGSSGITSDFSPGAVGTSWKIVGFGDADGDNKEDIFWRNDTSGTMSLWLLTEAGLKRDVFVGGLGDLSWQVVGIGDFNGDNLADEFWRNQSTGDMSIWFCSGTGITGQMSPGSVSDMTWQTLNHVNLNAGLAGGKPGAPGKALPPWAQVIR